MIGNPSQAMLCAMHGSPFDPPDEDDRVGVAIASLDQSPLNALRHLPASGTCGWYIWGGTLLADPDFFSPLHVHHLVEHAPDLVPYLALAPGWRVLLAPGQTEVWRDESLLDA